MVVRKLRSIIHSSIKIAVLIHYIPRIVLDTGEISVNRLTPSLIELVCLVRGDRQLKDMYIVSDDVQ